MVAVPSGSTTSAESCEVTSRWRRPQAPEPVADSSAYRCSSFSDIWCSARSANRLSGPRWLAASSLSFGERLGTEGRDPVGEAGEQRAHRGLGGFELAEQALRTVVARVGRDRCVDARLDDVEVGGDTVVFAQHAVGRVTVVRRSPGVARSARMPSSSNSVTSRSTSVGRALHRVDERTRRERLVDVGDAPSRQLHLRARSPRRSS